MYRFVVPIAVVLGLIGLGSVESARIPFTEGALLQPAQGRKSVKWQRPLDLTTFEGDPASDEEHTYIVTFDADSVALYEGGVPGLDGTRASADGKLDPLAPASLAYAEYLRGLQNEMFERMESEAGHPEVVRTLQHALNGAVVRMSEKTAYKVSRMDGVRSVERDRAVEPTTATSIGFIGATDVHEGNATGGVPFLGEGTVVGIIDSGINLTSPAHPSFAEVAGDGYAHENPLGDGNYLGDCLDPTYFDETGESLCNNKLIGAYTFLDGQDDAVPGNPYAADPILFGPGSEEFPNGQIPSADTDGHGTHVASTAAGNIVFNAPLINADGEPSDVTFDQISGVAPRANIIAYKVCAPSCFFSDITAAVDQAIADGIVDVLNHSIGSPGGSPWASSQAQAFLAARAAGIFVANSAGNSGPGAGTAEAAGNAPWVAGVAASTHPRAFPLKLLSGLSGGDLAPPGDLTGRGVTTGVEGLIVYAGDFPTSNGSANDTDPAQCLDPFPPGHFEGVIVVCDRGAIARVAKGQHVRDGGAIGLILANLDDGATSINDDPHVIPAIHIDAPSGNLLKEWLASGTDHAGTIEAVGPVGVDPAAGDNFADFSSRGPYTGFDILAPNITAPGFAIFAAGAELTAGQVALIGELYAGTPSEFPAVPEKYGEINGTSMSSPHIAGTAALMKQARPDWTAAEALSAMMTTGTFDMVKEDGITPADPHDFGGGRVQVALAINAGLVLDETAENFTAADPANGGDPATLNVASLVKSSCLQQCSWQRQVRATVSGTWTTSSADPWLSISPATFTLAAGEVQTIEIVAEVGAQPSGEWSFSRVFMTPDDPDVPVTHLVATVFPETGALPEEIALAAGRNADSQAITDITAVELTGFNVDVYELVRVEPQTFELLGDTDNTDAFDDLTDGILVQFVDTPDGARRFRAEILASNSPDLDMIVGLDLNGDGVPSADETFCTSATGSALEFCDFNLGGAIGLPPFWVLVQNWQASEEAPDAFDLAMTTVTDALSDSVFAEGPTTNPALEPFDVNFFWNFPSVPGERYLGATEWFADAEKTVALGYIPLFFNRGVDDVTFTVDRIEAAVGDTVAVELEVQPNLTATDREYLISVPVPDGLTVDPDSITDGGILIGGAVQWTVTQESLLGAEGEYIQTTNADDPACGTPFGDGSYLNLADFGIAPDPDAVGDGIALTYLSGQNPISFFGQPRDGGFTVTDDGFGFFNSTPGFLPFINLPIPSGDDPNDMVAPLWFDWILENDGERGLTVATAGPDLSIVEFDGVEPWTPDGSADPVADFEVFLTSTVDNSPGVYEIVFAYDNVLADFGVPPVATVGVENPTGTAGTQYFGPIESGLVICYDYQEAEIAPRRLSFTATVEGEVHGQDLEVNAFNIVLNNPGSMEESDTLVVEVEQLPYEFVGFLPPVEEGARFNTKSVFNRWFGIPVRFRLFDPVSGDRVTNAVATVTITDETGQVLREGDFRYKRFGSAYSYRLFPKGLGTGMRTITATLDDGTEQSVTIELFKEKKRFFWWW